MPRTEEELVEWIKGTVGFLMFLWLFAMVNCR